MRRIILTKDSKEKPWEIAYICIKPEDAYSLGEDILRQERLLGLKTLVATIDEDEYERSQMNRIVLIKLSALGKTPDKKKERQQEYD